MHPHHAARLFALILTAGAAHGADYFVRATGSNGAAGASPQAAWATVAHAAGRVQAGDTVYVGAGEYHGQLYMYNRAGTADSPIRFVADLDGARTGDAGEVTLSASNSVLHVQLSGHTQFHGFVLRNTSGTLAYNDNSASVLLENCSLASEGTTVHASNGGSWIVRDTALSSTGGHAVYMSAGSLAMSGVTVTGVGATSSALHAANNAAVTVERSSLLDGYDIIHSSGSKLTITNTVLAHARRNALFASNQTRVTLVHCTVSDVALDALSVNGGQQVVRNSVFTDVGDDVFERINNANLSVSGCLFFGVADKIGENFTIASPLVADPLFVSASADNFRVLAASPAIDAGADASVYTTVDRDGGPRPLGDGWDVGAYEGAGEAVTPAKRRVVRWREVAPTDD